ncbi:MAG TPA: DUF1326 domain-containing protein [Ktedonobacterales bacterium]
MRQTDQSSSASLAYHIERGQVRDLDVAGFSVVGITQVTGKMLEGRWPQVLIIDEQASPEQQRALMDALSGQLGGPLADQARLIDERLAVYTGPIAYQVQEGQGSLHVGELLCRVGTLYRRAWWAVGCRLSPTRLPMWPKRQCIASTCQSRP